MILSVVRLTMYSLKLFADDAKICTIIDSVNFNSSQLQRSLELVASWVVLWFFTKAIGNLRSFKCSERLQYLNLDSLQ